jgi:TetR/AcrR family transcriptional regulator, fatty acid metabolism regulator protein
MRIKDKPDGQNQPTFTETARRAQIIACAIETIAQLGYAQASLAQVAKRAGISKGVIVYYFSSKEELIKQVVKAIFTDAASFIGPKLAAQPTATLRLQAYIQAHVEYISTHLEQMMAFMEIAINFYRTEDGKLRFGAATGKPVLEALEDLLRKGQQEGACRDINLSVMAVNIRRAIDDLPHLFIADPGLDPNEYARELVTLFDRATRKE